MLVIPGKVDRFHFLMTPLTLWEKIKGNSEWETLLKFYESHCVNQPTSPRFTSPLPITTTRHFTIMMMLNFNGFFIAFSYPQPTAEPHPPNCCIMEPQQTGSNFEFLIAPFSTFSTYACNILCVGVSAFLCQLFRHHRITTTTRFVGISTLNLSFLG